MDTITQLGQAILRGIAKIEHIERFSGGKVDYTATVTVGGRDWVIRVEGVDK